MSGIARGGTAPFWLKSPTRHLLEHRLEDSSDDALFDLGVGVWLEEAETQALATEQFFKRRAEAGPSLKKGSRYWLSCDEKRELGKAISQVEVALAYVSQQPIEKLPYLVYGVLDSTLRFAAAGELASRLVDKSAVKKLTPALESQAIEMLIHYLLGSDSAGLRFVILQNFLPKLNSTQLYYDYETPEPVIPKGSWVRSHSGSNQYFLWNPRSASLRKALRQLTRRKPQSESELRLLLQAESLIELLG